CVDASSIKKGLLTTISGWGLKPLSILHSQFTEVLYLDADNFAVRDPAYLFYYTKYAETGSIFWPDIRRADKDSLIWKLMKLIPRDEWEFESGQMVMTCPRKRGQV